MNLPTAIQPNFFFLTAVVYMIYCRSAKYKYTRFSPAFCLYKEGKFKNGYYLPTIREILRTWSCRALGLCLLTKHLTVRYCLLPCGILSCFPKYSTMRRFKNSLKDYCFNHQCQSLTAVIIPIVISASIILLNCLSLRNYLLNLKILIRLLCCLHKVFTICYMYEPICWQNPIIMPWCP